MSKKNNYDTTGAKRMRNREIRIKESGLSNLKIVMHKDDAKEVRAYAKKLYEKRGITLL
ncbi:MAG: hypothetical protein RPS47_12695 [Colwellia sp.]|jgi:hypothetical protein